MAALNLGAKKRATFNELRVAEVRPLTESSVEVTFEVPEELAEQYDYSAGQYLALRATIDGEEVRRSYSICRPPGGGRISVAIKRDLGGMFSNWANDTLRAGQTIDVMIASGDQLVGDVSGSVNECSCDVLLAWFDIEPAPLALRDDRDQVHT